MKKFKYREKGMLSCLVISILAICLSPYVALAGWEVFCTYIVFIALYCTLYILILVKNKKEDNKYINHQTKTYIILGLFSLIISVLNIFIFAISIVANMKI